MTLKCADKIITMKFISIPMRVFPKSFLFAIFLPLFVSINFNANAGANSNIAIVNYVEIENKTLVSQDIAKQIQDRQTKLQLEVKLVQDDVQKKVADLEKFGAVSTAKALDVKKAALQKDLMQIDANLKNKAQKLENIKNDSLMKLNGKIKEIVESIAKKQGYDLVISENTTLYFDKKYDITADIIKELDAKMPKMKINWGEETIPQKKKK